MMKTSRGFCAFAMAFCAVCVSLLGYPADSEILQKAVKSAVSTRACDAPAIDGVLSDACWGKASFAAGFSDMKTRGPAGHDTEFAVCHDDENLYMAVRCKCGDGYVPKSSDKFWDGDLIEIFLDPGAGGYDYFHIAVTSAGAVFKERGYGRSDCLWSPRIRAAGHVEKGGWSLELAIPLADFQFRESIGATWLLNVARRDNESDGGYSTWAPAFGDLHQVSAFQPLTGLDVDLSRFLWRVAAKGDGLLPGNAATAGFELSNLAGRSQDVLLSMRIWRIGASYPSTCALGNFKVEAGRSISVASPPLLGGRGRYVVSLEGRDSMNRLVLRSRNYEFEKPKEALRATCNQGAFYRNETVCKVEARLFAKWKDGVKINFTLRSLKGGNALSQEVAPDENGRAHAAFDIKGLPSGDYEVVATWRGYAEAKSLFSILDRELNAAKVALSPGGALLVDGRPFFPKGLYMPEPWYGKNAEFPTDESDWADIKSKGFNMLMFSPFWMKTFMSGGPRINAGERRCAWKTLDRIDAMGLKAVMKVSDFCHADIDMPDFNGLRDYVAEFRGHPAVLSWYLADEPDLGGVPPENLEKAYRIIKELDPNHPVSMVVMGAFIPYSDSTDIMMADKYPIKDAESVPGTATYAVSRAGVRSLKTGQSFWMVPQFFCNYPQEDWKRCPTPEELTLMSFQSLCGGAKGLFNFAYSKPSLRSESGAPSPYPLEGKRLSWELWEGSARMNGLLSAAEPFILEGAPAQGIAVERNAAAGSFMQTLALRLGGKALVILCNSEGKPASAHVKGLSAYGKAVGMDFEGTRDLTLKDGVASVELKPWSATLLLCQ